MSKPKRQCVECLDDCDANQVLCDACRIEGCSPLDSIFGLPND